MSSHRKVRMISIGAAVQDVFLQGEIFKPHKDKNKELVEQFELGTKNDIDSVTFSTGGGATNASVTFARLGMESTYLGKVGDDVAGRSVIGELRKEGVDTCLVDVTHDVGTGYSVLLLAPNGERTILTYRGASENFDIKKQSFARATADWLYISSLSGDIASLKEIVTYAKSHNIKIAINPGDHEISNKEFKGLLENFTLLSVNKEEVQKLTGEDDIKAALKVLSKDIQYVVVTDGPNGSFATDGTQMYFAGMYEDVPVIDRTGAGDAFCSGFTAMIAQGNDIPAALTYGSANSTSVVGHLGAKTGILDETVKCKKMPITTEAL